MPALPAEKSVTTPAGQPRTTRLRRHEQHPRLIPAPGVTFADLGVPAPLVAALAEDGITVPFPVQAAVLPDALAGLDILGRAQTGSGKTLGFSIPLVARLAGGYTMACRPRGLVLVPTRELATQVQTVLSPLARAIDISAAVIRIFERLGWATSVHWPVPARLGSRRRGRGKPEPALQPGGRRTERAAASRRSPLPASGDRIR